MTAEIQPTETQPKVQVELIQPQPKVVNLKPEKTALVIVDMQNDHAHPDGVSVKSMRRTATIRPTQALLQRCRQAGAEVLYVQSLRDPDAAEFTVFGKTPYVVRGSWGAQIVDELTPLPGESIIEKGSRDCFHDTTMEAVLKEKGIQPHEWTIIVVGLGFTNCVTCAITGFSHREYWVVVPMDCTADANEEMELAAYQRFIQYGYNHNVTISRSDLIHF